MHMRIAFCMQITRPGRTDGARLRVDHVYMVRGKQHILYFGIAGPLQKLGQPAGFE